jgi:hypothetical protein
VGEDRAQGASLAAQGNEPAVDLLNVLAGRTQVQGTVARGLNDSAPARPPNGSPREFQGRTGTRHARLLKGSMGR